MGGPTSGQSNANLLPVDDLLTNFIGVIESPSTNRNASIGFIDTPGSGTQKWISTLFSDFSLGVGGADDFGGSQDENLAAERFGHFLVRGGASVPEPSTLALLTIGLAGVGFAGRRKLAA